MLVPRPSRVDGTRRKARSGGQSLPQAESGRRNINSHPDVTMTESTANAAAAPAKSPSFWEDVIDIFYQPAEVFRRREGKSAWPPLLFVAIAIGVIVFATFNTLEPIFDAEFTRAQRRRSRRIRRPPDAIEQDARHQRDDRQVLRSAPIMLVTMFVLGVVTWLVGKLVGSRQTFQAAIAVAAWAYMPRVLGAVVNGGVRACSWTRRSSTRRSRISIGPARFFDPDATNPMLYQLLGRFDLFTIWVRCCSRSAFTSPAR